MVLEGVSNADNVGGVFRNAAAFGADGVLLSPTCCDPLYRKAIRTSMGAALRVPFARADDEDWPGVLDACPRRRVHHRRAHAARAVRNTRCVHRAAASAQRLALIVGTEGAGLTPAVESAADYRVRIPIGDDVDSLNVAVAAGIALYRCRPRSHLTNRTRLVPFLSSEAS